MNVYLLINFYISLPVEPVSPYNIDLNPTTASVTLTTFTELGQSTRTFLNAAILPSNHSICPDVAEREGGHGDQPAA